MKLNVAAALFQSERPGRARLIVSLVLASLFFFSSGAVMAADEVDSVESEESAPEPHALATAIANDDAGEADETEPAVENATWENSRQIAVGDPWVEGDAYWGPAYQEEGAYRLGDTKYDR